MGIDFRYGKERYKVEAEIMNRHNFRTPDDLFSASLQAARSYPIKKSKIFKDFTPAIDGMELDIILLIEALILTD